MSTLNAYIKAKSKDKLTKVRFRYRSGVEIDLDYTSDILINPQFWDSKKQILKKSTKFPIEEIVQLNSLITERKNTIMDIILSTKNSKLFNSAYLNKQIRLKLNNKKDPVKKHVLDFFQLFDLFLETHNLSQERKESYQVTKRALERFEYKNQLQSKNFKISFDEINGVLLNEIESFLSNEYDFIKQNKEFRKRFPKYKSNKPRGINTVIGMMKKIRSFNNWAIRNEYTQSYAFRKYKMSDCIYGTPMYLTLIELGTLYHYSFSDSPQLEIQRDVFLFQSMTGLRVGDMIKLTISNIIDGSLQYVPQKTKNENGMTIIVPLNTIAQNILEKYKNYVGEKLLPFISNQQYNNSIKEMLTIAGVNRRVTVLNTINRDYEIKSINEIASSHLARRNFIANLYNCVQDQTILSVLTGHVIGSKSFERYRTIDNELKKSIVSHLEFD